MIYNKKLVSELWNFKIVISFQIKYKLHRIVKYFIIFPLVESDGVQYKTNIDIVSTLIVTYTYF